MTAKTEFILSARDETKAAFDSATRNMSAMSSSAATLSTAFGGLARLSIASLGIAGIGNLIKSAIDAQDNLKDLSKTTQISIADLAGLSSAAQKSGSDLESIASSVNKLAVNMGKDPEKFRQIGITAKEPIEAFKQLADVFNAIDDPQQRAAFGAAALGKAWQGAAPLLSEGGSAIGEMVDKGKALSKVTEESAAKADELNDQLVDLKSNGAAIATQFANLLVPSLNDTARAMLETAEKGNPLLALLRGFAGLGKIPFDLALGSVDTGIGAQIKDLETELGRLQSQRKQLVGTGGGLLNEWVYGKKDDLDQKIKVTANQLAALQKYGDVTKNRSSSDAPLGGTKIAPDVRKFIDNDKASAGRSGKSAKARPDDPYSDALTPSAQAYAKAMEDVGKAMREADESTMTLDASQKALYELMLSPGWNDMPHAWKETAIAQAEAGTAALKTADDYKRLQSLLAATPTEKLEITRGNMVFLADAFKAGTISAEQFSEAAQAALGTLPEQAKEATDAMTVFAEQAARNMQDAFADFLFDPFKAGTKGLLENFGTMLHKMAAQAASAQITSAIFGKAGGGEGAGLFGGAVDWFKGLFTANANGGVYSAPGLSAYSGSVVSTPTLFPFARGVGLMGEAGPEAILPLSKGADGKLGVQGSGGGVVVNVINNAAGTQATQQTRQDPGGKTIIDVMIETVKSAIAKDIGSGGSVAGAMESQYGLNRAAGAWR